MNIRFAPCIVTLLICFATVCTVCAQVPQLINYQGRVAVGTVNFNGTGLFKFALVNGSGTTTYWSNDGTSVAGAEPTAAVTLTLSNGLYSILLGDALLANMSVLPATVFTNSDVRLRVWFNDGTNGSQQFTPDQRIAAVGFAMMADNVSDAAITTAKLAPGAVGTNALSANAITSPKIAGSAITTDKLADGAVTAQKLTPGLFSTFPNGIAVFSSSGTWTRPPGVKTVWVKLWGGGGGHQFKDNASAGYGGGGGYCEGVVAVTSNVAITVGAAGQTGYNNAGTSSTDGGSSSFLSLVANGGLRGPNQDTGGGGGGASGGAIIASGESGGVSQLGGSPGRAGAQPGVQPGGPGGGGSTGLVIVYY